jgi:glycosyltransferase involved in cell wall biosynthesis
MRVLFLTFQVPFPPVSGGAIKSGSLLAYLRQRHEVRLICFRREPLTPEQERWCAESGPLEVVPLNKGRSPANLARSYLSGVPLSIERNRSPRMADLVSRRLRDETFDAVLVDGWLMAQYLPRDYGGLALLHEHNAEYVMWRRRAESERNPLLRLAVRREGERVRRYEASILPRFDTVFAVSESDRRALEELGADPARLRLLPNLPDASLLDMPSLSFEDAEAAVLYVGTLSWPPNVQAVEFLLAEAFPRLRALRPEARLLIAGAGAPARLEALARRTPGAEFLGPVPDVEPLYRRARVAVEPGIGGGGTRVKVLNALARGLPVVAGPVAAEGLGAEDGVHLLVAGDVESTAESVVRLLDDEALWRSLSEAGRALIRDRYLAEVAYAPLDEALSPKQTRTHA